MRKDGKLFGGLIICMALSGSLMLLSLLLSAFFAPLGPFSILCLVLFLCSGVSFIAVIVIGSPKWKQNEDLFAFGIAFGIAFTAAGILLRFLSDSVPLPLSLILIAAGIALTVCTLAGRNAKKQNKHKNDDNEASKW